jgi:hypothetical protein
VTHPDDDISDRSRSERKAFESPDNALPQNNDIHVLDRYAVGVIPMTRRNK